MKFSEFQFQFSIKKRSSHEEEKKKGCVTDDVI